MIHYQEPLSIIDITVYYKLEIVYYKKVYHESRFADSMRKGRFFHLSTPLFFAIFDILLLMSPKSNIHIPIPNYQNNYLG